VTGILCARTVVVKRQHQQVRCYDLQLLEVAAFEVAAKQQLLLGHVKDKCIVVGRLAQHSHPELYSI